MARGAELTPPTGAIDHLNALLRGELAAVATYQSALRSLDGRIPVDAAEILQFASEHQRTVATLQVAVRTLGGSPAVEAGTWGAFALLRDTATLRALVEGEEGGLAAYQAALLSLDGDARELVELELIPRQRRHIAQLSAILVRLGA